jgi:hypothetical protein
VEFGHQHIEKEKKMKKIMVAMILISLIVGATSVAAEDIILWGKQTKGWGATNAKTDGKAITLKKTATIIKVEGTTNDYCIWSGGRSVLCGGNGRPSIIGKTLSPGRYTVMAGLDGQSSAEVKIYLQEK